MRLPDIVGYQCSGGTMAESNLRHLPKGPLTPLWIIALFVSLVETVLGIGVMQTTGWVQGALTIFVMIFPLLIAGGFFGILWFKPYVLYPPSEFSQQDVSAYVKAMQQRGTEDVEIYKIVTEAVREALVSNELITMLQKNETTVSRVEVSEILSKAAEIAVEEVREKTFVTVKYSEEIRNYDSRIDEATPDSLVEQIPVTSSTTVARFLSIVAGGTSAVAVRTGTYKEQWILRNEETGHLLEHIGILSEKLLVASGTIMTEAVQLDTRTLQEVGVKPGMALEVILFGQQGRPAANRAASK